MLLKLNKMISLNLHQFIIITVGIICTAICNVAYPYSLKYIFNELASKNIKQLSIVLMTILSVLIIQATIPFIVSRFLSKIVQTYLFEKKLKLFNYMLSVDFQDEREKFQTIINSDFEQLGQQIVNFFILIIYYSTLILSYISALFSLNAKLTLILLLTVPLILCTNIILGIYIQKIYFKSKQYLDAVNKNITELISGNLIIKAFSAQQYIFKKFSINNKLLKKNNIYYDTLQAFSNSCVALFSIVAPFIVLSIGIIYVLKKEISTELISGNLIIKAFSAQQYIFKKFSINNKLLKKNNIYYDTLQAFSNSCVALFSIVAPFIVLSIGIIYVLKKEISMGTLIAIYTFAGAIFPL